MPGEDGLPRTGRAARIAVDGPTCPIPACSTCAALRDAAVRLVSDGALAGASLERAAARVGLGPPAARRHYADLEECLVAAYRHGVGRLQRLVARALASRGSRRARLLAAADAMIDEVVANPALMRFCMVDGWRVDLPALADARVELRERTIQLLTESSDAGAAVPEARLEMFVGGLHHALASELERPGCDRRRLLLRAKQVIDLFEPLPATPAV